MTPTNDSVRVEVSRMLTNSNGHRRERHQR